MNWATRSVAAALASAEISEGKKASMTSVTGALSAEGGKGVASKCFVNRPRSNILSKSLTMWVPCLHVYSVSHGASAQIFMIRHVDIAQQM